MAASLSLGLEGKDHVKAQASLGWNGTSCTRWSIRGRQHALPLAASAILRLAADEPDPAALAGVEGAVDHGDLAPAIGGELLHE
jgi:hypothetical protein